MDIYQYILTLSLLFLAAEQARLKDVNQRAKRHREAAYNENPYVTPIKVNDYVLGILNCGGYLEDNFWPKVDEAIKEGYYSFLRSLYPTTKIQWNDRDSVRLLAKAYNQPNWMSEREWYVYSKNVNPKLLMAALDSEGKKIPRMADHETFLGIYF